MPLVTPIAFLGPQEIIILVLIVIAFFGVTRLPQIGKMLGRRARLAQHAVGETKDALKEGYDESGPVVDAEVVDEPERRRSNP